MDLEKKKKKEPKWQFIEAFDQACYGGFLFKLISVGLKRKLIRWISTVSIGEIQSQITSS